MSNTITAAGIVATTPRHFVTAEGLHVLSFRITEAGGNDYVIHTQGELAAANFETVTEGMPLTVAGVLTLRSWDAGTFHGISAEISAEWIGRGAEGGQFEEGAKYALESLAEFIDGVERTDVWAEFFGPEEDN